MSPPLGRAAFEAELQKVLDEKYHDLHPFNLRMHEGDLGPEAIRTWVRNRYYYQTRIPIKDGMILSKSPDADFRRQWIQRIQDHDGSEAGQGGLALWLALATAVGLNPEEVQSLSHILPGVRSACDDYVDFVASHDLLESVAASLTELSASKIMPIRIAAFETHYPWVDSAGLGYFRSRCLQAPRDAEQGMAFVLDHALDRADQDQCLGALNRKCEILWNLLDSVETACDCPKRVSHAMLREAKAGRPAVVVLPERAIELSGTGPAILGLCDGIRSGMEIAAIMSGLHPTSPSVEDDTHRFLESMKHLRVVELLPKTKATPR